MSLNNSINDPSDDFIEEKVKEYLDNEKTEIRYSLQLLYYLFQEKSHEYAESYMILLRTNSVNFPPFLKKYLDDEFFPYYYKFIHYLKEPHLNKLDRTNNKTEGYFKGTMPKCQKRKFRTMKGIINQIYYQGRGWIKNAIKSRELRRVRREKLIEKEKKQIEEMGLKMNFKKRF